MDLFGSFVEDGFEMWSRSQMSLCTCRDAFVIDFFHLEMEFQRCSFRQCKEVDYLWYTESYFPENINNITSVKLDIINNNHTFFHKHKDK